MITFTSSDIAKYVYCNLFPRLWHYKSCNQPFLSNQVVIYLKKKINKNLDNKKSFKGEVKNVFHRFQRTLSCQKLPQAWECAFNFSISSYFFIIVIINFYLFIYLFFACFKIIWILFLMLGVGLVIFSYFKYSAVVLFAFSLFTEMATSTWSLRKPRDSVFWRLIYQSV